MKLNFFIYLLVLVLAYYIASNKKSAVNLFFFSICKHFEQNQKRFIIWQSASTVPCQIELNWNIEHSTDWHCREIQIVNGISEGIL